MPIINITLGKGLKFNARKITTDWITNGNVEKKTDGLYIPSLKGSSGTGGTTTLIEANTLSGTSNGVLKTVGTVVQYIFSMCVFTVTSNANPYTVDIGTYKDVKAIVRELNKLSINRITSYIMKPGDLFMLKGHGTLGTINSGGVYMDDGNRYDDDACVVLFVIKQIDYFISNPYNVTRLDLQCIYSAIPQYAENNVYSNTDEI